MWIYALKDPTTAQVRYVGKAVDPERRLNEHMCRSKKSTIHKYRWIQKVLRSGQYPVLVHLQQATADNWQRLERKWIKYFRCQEDLTNLTCGGDGVIGYVYTPEAREKMSVARRKRPPLSEETKRKISLAHLNRPSFSVTHCENISLAKMGQPLSEETKRKMSLAHQGRIPWNTGKRLSEEHKRKLSYIGRGRKHSEETKHKISLSGKGKHFGRVPWNKNKRLGPLSEEQKRKMSVSLKKWYANHPESKPMLGKHHSEEAKKRMSLAAKMRRVKKFLRSDS